MNGHTLDLVMSAAHDPLSVTIKDVDRSVSSDHFAVIFTVQIPRPHRNKKSISVRKWRAVDMEAFDRGVAMLQPELENADDPFAAYNDLVSTVRDQHAPSVNIEITERSSTPWFTSDLRHIKTSCRQLERKWRRSKLVVDEEIFKDGKRRLRESRDEAKKKYIEDKLTNARSNKDTFNVLNHLLHKDKSSPLPQHDCEKVLADKFAVYFLDKIKRVRDKLPPPSASSVISSNLSITPLSSFPLLSYDELRRMLGSMAPKSCLLDPLPSWIVKQSPALSRMLHHVINWSLSSAQLPQSQKTAHVRPLLKKPSLDCEEYKNYRPVSNLSFASKLTEKAVACVLKNHCTNNNLSLNLQSAYRSGHSTETALTKVHNDLLMAVDSQGAAVLVLLDLSAAFDTIDHELLLTSLECHYAITGDAKKWFRSYLTNRQQLVVIGNDQSEPNDLEYGVPQGSVLGPTLFSMYTKPLADVISACGMQFHMYADDTQLYIPMNVRSSVSKDEVAQTIDVCTNHVKQWMSDHFLKLNGDKTELLVITSPSLKTRAPSSFSFLGELIQSQQVVRDLGVLLDDQLTMKAHISDICKRAFYQLRLIHQVRPFITEEAARQLVNANVTSLLDYTAMHC